MRVQVPTFGRRVAQLAQEHPKQTAVIFLPQQGDDRTITWREYNITPYER
jgi:hypothetical protein